MQQEGVFQLQSWRLFAHRFPQEHLGHSVPVAAVSSLVGTMEYVENAIVPNRGKKGNGTWADVVVVTWHAPMRVSSA